MPDQQKPADPNDQTANDAYAQSLLKMVNMDYERKRAEQPKVKHVFSKKRLVFLAVTIIVTIILGIAVSRVAKPATSQTKEVINGAQNFNNPDAY